MVTRTFLLFDIRTAVVPLEVYLQNLESVRSLRNYPAFEADQWASLTRTTKFT